MGKRIKKRKGPKIPARMRQIAESARRMGAEVTFDEDGTMHVVSAAAKAALAGETNDTNGTAGGG